VPRTAASIVELGLQLNLEIALSGVSAKVKPLNRLQSAKGRCNAG
jgi:hypothetical protein